MNHADEAVFSPEHAVPACTINDNDQYLKERMAFDGIQYQMCFERNSLVIKSRLSLMTSAIVAIGAFYAYVLDKAHADIIAGHQTLILWLPAIMCAMGYLTHRSFAYGANKRGVVMAQIEERIGRPGYSMASRDGKAWITFESTSRLFWIALGVLTIAVALLHLF